MTGKTLAVYAIVVLLVAGALLTGCGQQEPVAVTPQGPPSGSPPGPLTAGPAEGDVPLVIEAYYPMNEGHKFIADYLLGVAEANPGTIRVAVYDMQSENGRAKWSTTGLTCAGVFVNGSTRHELEKEGETETVDFLQRMDVFWSHGDFEAVVAQELEKAGKTFNTPPEPVAPEPEETTAEESTESGQ